MIINEKEIAKGIHLCISNAGRYTASAEILLIENRVQDAHLLCLYALEEIGKVPLIANLPFYLDSSEDFKSWKKRFRDHEEKFHFSKDIDDFKEERIPDKSNEEDRKRSLEKQNISYVSFNETFFSPPGSSSAESVKQLLDIVKERLVFLRKNHPSVEVDEQRLINSTPELKGLNLQQLQDLWKKLKGE